MHIHLGIRLVMGLITFVVIIAGCGSKRSDADSRQTEGALTQFQREQTLYVGGFQWGPPPSFNPLAVTPAWPITGNMNLIYESMFGYNLLDGSLRGILATSYELNKRRLVVTLNDKAHWQNGDSLTSDDVVFTFLMHKKYSTAFHSHWNYINDVRSDGPHKVVFTLSDINYNPLIMRDIIASTPIIPRRIFSGLEESAYRQLTNASGSTKPSDAEVLNMIRENRNDIKPIGSGPYTLETYSDQKIVLKRVDSYWGKVLYDGKLPAPVYIVHSSYQSNDKFNLALQQGNLDISQTFCPQIWNKFKFGVGTWYPSEPYYIPGIIPSLLMGLTRAPFDDVNFRQAAAHAIDYDQIKRLAVYGYTPDLKPGFILPFGTEKEFFSDEDAAQYGVLYDPAKSREILKKAGYSWGADNMLIDPQGQKVRTLTATCPSGWTDWESTIKIAVTGMRAIGIDVREKFVEYPVWDKDLKNGLFDFTMKTPQPESAPSLPWSRFEKVMSSKEWRPAGEIMYENEGRYRSPDADRLLREIPAMTDAAMIRQGYRELNKLFMKEMPVIPLMYRPWLFYQFSTKAWTNFPTEKNPYAPPQCLMVGAGVEALWGIVAVQKH